MQSLPSLVLREGLSEDDSEEEEERVSGPSMGQEKEEDTDLQLNMETDEKFLLPSSEVMEKENILPCYMCMAHTSRVHGIADHPHSCTEPCWVVHVHCTAEVCWL